MNCVIKKIMPIFLRKKISSRFLAYIIKTTHTMKSNLFVTYQSFLENSGQEILDGKNAKELLRMYVSGQGNVSSDIIDEHFPLPDTDTFTVDAYVSIMLGNNIVYHIDANITGVAGEVADSRIVNSVKITGFDATTKYDDSSFLDNYSEAEKSEMSGYAEKLFVQVIESKSGWSYSERASSLTPRDRAESDREDRRRDFRENFENEDENLSNEELVRREVVRVLPIIEDALFNKTTSYKLLADEDFAKFGVEEESKDDYNVSLSIQDAVSFNFLFETTVKVTKGDSGDYYTPPSGDEVNITKGKISKMEVMLHGDAFGGTDITSFISPELLSKLTDSDVLYDRAWTCVENYIDYNGYEEDDDWGYDD
jgi:hypothetical protein